MARTSFVKQVGAGVVSGTVALLACNNFAEDEHEPYSGPRLHPLPVLTSSTPTMRPSRKPNSTKGKKMAAILRRATTFRKEVRCLSIKQTTLPNDSHQHSSDANPMRTALNLGISNVVKIRKTSSPESVGVPNTAPETYEELNTEISTEAIVGDTAIPTLATAVEHTDTSDSPGIDTIVSGFAESFSSEVLDSTLFIEGKPSAIPHDNEHVEAYPPFNTVKTIFSSNSSGIGSSNTHVSTIAQSEKLSTVIVPPITNEAALPFPSSSKLIDLAPSASLHDFEGTDNITNGHVDFVQTSAKVPVDSATQTDETELMPIPKLSPSQNSPVESDFQDISSHEESLMDNTPPAGDTVQSGRTSELNSEAIISKLEEEVAGLHRVNYNLNERVVDLETSEEVLDEEIRQLRHEKEEFEHEAEYLRGRLEQVEIEHEDKVAAEIAAYERSRKYDLQQIQDHYQTGAWQGLAQNMKLQLKVKEQNEIIKGQQQLLEGLKKNTARQAVVSMADSLQKARLELITHARETYQLNNEITFLKTRLQDTEQAQRLLPQIEEQVRRLLQERETLQHQLDTLRRQRPTAPCTTGLNDGVFRGFNN